jgi:hypothetical protein
MPTVHNDTCIESAREQLSYARAEIILGARRLRAEAAPSVEDSHLMADAVLEYFAALDAIEAAVATEPAARDLDALRAYACNRVPHASGECTLGTPHCTTSHGAR